MPNLEPNMQGRILSYLILIVVISLSTTLLMVFYEHYILCCLFVVFVLPQLGMGYFIIEPKGWLTWIATIIISVISFCLFLFCVYCSILIEKCNVLVYTAYIIAYLQIPIVWEISYRILKSNRASVRTQVQQKIKLNN